MAIAHVSTEDYLLIGQAFTDYVEAHKTGSVVPDEWPDVLGADLFKRAVEGGYFGPKGTIDGLDYSVATVKGAQVQGVSNDEGSFTYTLYVDGEPVASEKGGASFDTVVFAKRHGQEI